MEVLPCRHGTVDTEETTGAPQEVSEIVLTSGSRTRSPPAAPQAPSEPSPRTAATAEADPHGDVPDEGTDIFGLASAVEGVPAEVHMLREALATAQTRMGPALAALRAAGASIELQELRKENAMLRERLHFFEGAAAAATRVDFPGPSGQVASSEVLLRLPEASAEASGSAEQKATSLVPASADEGKRVRLAVRVDSQGKTGPLRRDLSMPCRMDAPPRAFVINVRRLIDAQETLNLLHELIRSTSIAALTLVSAQTLRQFRSTMVFLASTLLIFRRHDRHWDMLDVKDVEMLLPLIADDDDNDTSNPNSLLKVMSTAENKVWRYMGRLVHLVGGYLCVWAWLICGRQWASGAINEFGEIDESVGGDLLGRWLQYFVFTEDDGISFSMQVGVGSLMFLLHLAFEILYYHETCAVMPRTASNGIWDPRTDGLPWRYQIMGLPSMWFTSKEAKEDLKYWIDQASPNKHVVQIFAQELAYYAVGSDSGRMALQRALKESKLFDGRRREFTDRHKAGKPEALNIELCFFDTSLQNKSCECQGEFLCMSDAESVAEATPSSDRSTNRMVPRNRTL